MLQTVWAGENRKMTVCFDAYEGGVMKGRIVNAYQETEPFGSMVQFLTAVEAILEDQQIPQSYTSMRRFVALYNIYR